MDLTVYSPTTQTRRKRHISQMLAWLHAVLHLGQTGGNPGGILGQEKKENLNCKQIPDPWHITHHLQTSAVSSLYLYLAHPHCFCSFQQNRAGTWLCYRTSSVSKLVPVVPHSAVMHRHNDITPLLDDLIPPHVSYTPGCCHEGHLTAQLLSIHIKMCWYCTHRWHTNNIMGYNWTFYCPSLCSWLPFTPFFILSNQD